ncbi:hypothetical protein C8R45DRAFT_1100349 [Mycena sanguinolenta]|nr:hypothetical protein C8R45DRAFT_1100349 [Mycena sanguinolenta]
MSTSGERRSTRSRPNNPRVPSSPSAAASPSPFSPPFATSTVPPAHPELGAHPEHLSALPAPHCVRTARLHPPPYPNANERSEPITVPIAIFPAESTTGNAVLCARTIVAFPFSACNECDGCYVDVFDQSSSCSFDEWSDSNVERNINLRFSVQASPKRTSAPSARPILTIVTCRVQHRDSPCSTAPRLSIHHRNALLLVERGSAFDCGCDEQCPIASSSGVRRPVAEEHQR